MSQFSDLGDLADVERTNNTAIAVAKTMRQYTFHLAYRDSRGKVKTEMFPGTASDKVRKLEELGLDDASMFCSIAQRADDSWTELCGNKELAKYLSGVPAKFRR